MKTFCPRTSSCPIFKEGVLLRETSIATYKNLYCTAGPQRYRRCMRYKTAKKYGKCPASVMPNSTLSWEEIEKKIKEST